MKLSRATVLILFLFPLTTFAQRNVAAERAWKPFLAAFRAAVKERDRVALRRMMPDDFFSSGGNDAGVEAAF